MSIDGYNIKITKKMASDDEFTTTNDLTVTLPDTDGIKMSKPVKLKRKLYDAPTKKRLDARGDEEEEEVSQFELNLEINKLIKDQILIIAIQL